MPKLPQLRWKAAPRGRAERLARWLDEWHLEQDLRQSDPDYERPVQLSQDERVLDYRFHQLIAPFDPEPTPKDIRLLSPLLFGALSRPVYVAILARNAEWFIVAPFGPFLEPATKTEWATGRTEHALRVLCLWNSRTLPKEVIAQSWLVDRLELHEQKTAWAVFQHATRGTTLPEDLLSSVGCPITHPRDPRLQYQAEEINLLAPLMRSIPETGKPVHEHLLLAAGSRDSAHELIEEWERRVEGSPCRLRFRESALEITIAVSDANGNPSMAFNKAELIDRNNRMLDAFDGPLAAIRREDRALVFAIRTDAGSLLRLL